MLSDHAHFHFPMESVVATCSASGRRNSKASRHRAMPAAQDSACSGTPLSIGDLRMAQVRNAFGVSFSRWFLCALKKSSGVIFRGSLGGKRRGMHTINRGGRARHLSDRTHLPPIRARKEPRHSVQGMRHACPCQEPIPTANHNRTLSAPYIRDAPAPPAMPTATDNPCDGLSPPR